MLDVGTAIEIEEQNERNRAMMREQVSAQIENNQLNEPAGRDGIHRTGRAFGRATQCR